MLTRERSVTFLGVAADANHFRPGVNELVTLSAPERDIVKQSLVSFSLKKGWRLRAAHVRSNHGHAVRQADREPGRPMSDLNVI